MGINGGFLQWLSGKGKESACKAGATRDAGSVARLGGYPGGGHGNPLQYSCLENPMDRGAWQTTVHRVAKSWTRLKWLSTHTHVSTGGLVRTSVTHLSDFLFQTTPHYVSQFLERSISPPGLCIHSSPFPGSPIPPPLCCNVLLILGAHSWGFSLNIPYSQRPALLSRLSPCSTDSCSILSFLSHDTNYTLLVWWS